MAYDRADWHYGGEFPKDLKPENGATHIGMFLAWAITRGLVGELHIQESQDAVAAVKTRTMTGSEFLMSQCDEKFTDEDLSEEGNAFAKSYYETNTYLLDYSKVLENNLPSLYHVADTWENFDKLAPVIDSRFTTWKNPTKKSWWHFKK